MGFRSSHNFLRRPRTEGNPPTWSPCLCDRIMSDTSGSFGLACAASRRAEARTGMYSSFPSPVSIRVYGFWWPMRYVLVPLGDSTFQCKSYSGWTHGITLQGKLSRILKIEVWVQDSSWETCYYPPGLISSRHDHSATPDVRISKRSSRFWGYLTRETEARASSLSIKSRWIEQRSSDRIRICYLNLDHKLTLLFPSRE